MDASMEAHLSDCDVCRGWLANCMVEPIRGHPCKETLQIRDAQQIIQRLKFWKDFKHILVAHGVNYDPTTEKIGAYPNY